MISPVLIDNLGGKAYLIFMAIAVCCPAQGIARILNQMC